LIEQAVVFGDNQPGLSALIVPAECGRIKSDEIPTQKELIAAEIDRCLASAAHEEQVRRFAILDRPFSIERGELTPKMSLCRSVIARNFANKMKAFSPQSAQSTQNKNDLS
jgi:long-chain acyl-CoA synthetase